MDTISHLGEIFAWCWRAWNYPFTISGITFTLANVAEVSVLIFVLGVVLDALLQGGWGGSD